MERFFQITAVILAGVAAYFLWQGSADRAFATAVFGAVSFFLSVRFQVKGRLDQREAERLEKEKRREEEEEQGRRGEDDLEDSMGGMPQLNDMAAGEQFDNEHREQIDREQRTTDKERNRTADKEQI